MSLCYFHIGVVVYFWHSIIVSLSFKYRPAGAWSGGGLPAGYGARGGGRLAGRAVVGGAGEGWRGAVVPWPLPSLGSSPFFLFLSLSLSLPPVVEGAEMELRRLYPAPASRDQAAGSRAGGGRTAAAARAHAAGLGRRRSAAAAEAVPWPLDGPIGRPIFFRVTWRNERTENDPES